MRTQTIITQALLDSALTFEQYTRLADERLRQGRSTADDPAYNTPEILGYTKLNLARMSRLAKQTVVQPELAQAISRLSQPYIWLVLTESWCGDAAQTVPVLGQVADQAPAVTFRLLLRDQHPAVMDAYLTNGARSIPKLIVLHRNTLEEVATWGPRPAALQALMADWRAAGLPFTDVVERAQRWYNDDRTQSTQAELLALVEGLGG